jgi:hypothetical protein
VLFSGIVTADETFLGPNPKNLHRRERHGRDHKGQSEKTAVLSLVERETGAVRSRVVPNVRANTLKAAIHAQVDLPRTILHTDSAASYVHLGWKAAEHHIVNHKLGEYVRGTSQRTTLKGSFRN